MSSRPTALALALVAALAITAGAHTVLAADQVDPLGSFQDWSAYTFLEDGNKVCYALAQPKEARHGGRPRGKIYALVTHRPAKNSTNVVSFIAGYNYKPGSEVTVKIGTRNFSLFTEGDGAWARDEETDNRLVQAIRAGLTMVVEGVSEFGTETTDIYSLRGSTAAINAINRACGVDN